MHYRSHSLWRDLTTMLREIIVPFALALIAMYAALMLATCAAHADTLRDICYPEAIRLCGAPRSEKLSPETRAALVVCMTNHASEISERCKRAFFESLSR